MDALLTPTELRTALKVSERSYHRLVERGMPCRFVMSARRFVLAEVLAWLPRPRVSPSAVSHEAAGDLVSRFKFIARAARRRHG